MSRSDRVVLRAVSFALDIVQTRVLEHYAEQATPEQVARYRLQLDEWRLAGIVSTKLKLAQRQG